MDEQIQNLTKKLENYSKAYYEGTPEISDEEFDSIKECLRRIDPNNPFLNKVGWKFQSGKTIEHNYPMLSILDVKNEKDAYKWINELYNKFNPYVEDNERTVYIENKIDGTSGSLHYDKNGYFKYAVTRGDGKIGNKIMFAKIMISNDAFPSHIDSPLKENFEIRGEFFIPLKFKNEYAELKDKPLRNLCSGTLNRLIYSDIFKIIKFCPYQIYTKSEGLITYSEKDKWFWEKRLFNYYPNRELINIEEIESYYLNYLIERNENKFDYETDGLVLTFPENELFNKIDSYYVIKSDHRYNLALKPPAKRATTVIEKIEWNVSRTGRLIPVAILNPVKINDINITNVTLNNAEFIKVNNITEGSIIEIERAGEVIPHFLSVVEESDKPLVLPENCPICGTKLKNKGVDLICPNNECTGKLINSIVYWLKDVHDVEGIAEKTVEKICKFAKPKINDVVDFYEFILQDKFGYIINGEKEQDIIYEAVKNSLDDISEMSIMEGCGISGFKKAKLMKYGIYTIKNLKNFKYKVGMGENEKLLDEWLKDKNNINKLNKYYNYFQKYIKERIISKNWKISVTGKFDIPRKEIIKKIEKSGCIYSETVGATTKYLVNDDNEISSKMKAASKFNIPIISLKELTDILDSK